MTPTVERWPRGRCEKWLSPRHMCGDPGRWMIDGQIRCAAHVPHARQVRIAADTTKTEDVTPDEMILCGTRTGRLAHLARPGSSVTACGHWLKFDARQYRLRWVDGYAICSRCLPSENCPYCAPDELCALHQESAR